MVAHLYAMKSRPANLAAWEEAYLQDACDLIAKLLVKVSRSTLLHLRSARWPFVHVFLDPPRPGQVLPLKNLISVKTMKLDNVCVPHIREQLEAEPPSQILLVHHRVHLLAHLLVLVLLSSVSISLG